MKKNILDKLIKEEKINENEETRLREKLGIIIKEQILENIKNGTKSKI